MAGEQGFRSACEDIVRVLQTRWFLLLVLCASLVAVLVAELTFEGKWDRWEEANSRARSLFEGGEYARAIAIQEECVELLRGELPNNPRLAQELYNLGVLYLAERRLSDAREAYEESLAIYSEAFLGPDSVHYVKTLLYLADVEISLERWDEAQEHLQRATGIVTTYTPGDVDALGALRKLRSCVDEKRGDR